MRAWLVVVFAVVLGAQAAAGRTLTREQLGLWVQSYHAAPKPDEIPDALASMHEANVLSQPGTALPVVGFLSAVFARHPDRVGAWLGDVGRFPEPVQRALVQAVWLSGTSQSRALLTALGPEKLASIVKRDLSQVAPPVSDRIAVRGPQDLDFLWGRFFGSGGAEPVRTIIGALAVKNVKREISPGKIDAVPLMIGSAAEWSLISNASRYERVLEICRAELAGAGGDTAELLSGIIAKAEERRKSRV